VLVFIVMYLFLQNFRYTIIPTIVVPVALLGSFASLLALGFSINVLTMFGMVLVIGIVVDDAIVVVENVERIMSEEGLPPLQATRKAMGQISGAIIGVTVVLMSVFVPLAFFSGAVGNIYRQFSAVMVSSIGFSAFLALSLTPALCAHLLKPVEAGHHTRSAVSSAGSTATSRPAPSAMKASSARSCAAPAARWSCSCCWSASSALMFTRMPNSFLPNEDQGYVIANIQLPPGATPSAPTSCCMRPPKTSC
jgi:multidrug efflux pump